jgi:ferredoxin-NADP reductase
VTTREAHGIRPAARLTAVDLLPLWEEGQTAFVCGSTGFAEAASQLLVEMGMPPASIRVERFGPSGS